MEANPKSQKAPILGVVWQQAAEFANYPQERIPALRQFLSQAKKEHDDSRFKTVMARPGPLAEGAEYLFSLTVLFVDYTRSNQCPDKLREIRKELARLRPSLPEDLQSAQVFALAERSPQSVRNLLCPMESMTSR